MMKEFLLTITMSFMALLSTAHGVDISTIVFAEKEENIWTLQVVSALDAFRKEVKIHYSDAPYTTPEEFNSQLLDHLQENLRIFVDGQQALALGKGMVNLGHETVVFYNEIKFPDDATALKIVGEMFKDIHRSKIKLLILKKGYDKQPFILDQKNNYTADLVMKENRFEIKEKEEFPLSYSLLFVFVGLIAVIIWKMRATKTRMNSHD